MKNKRKQVIDEDLEIVKDNDDAFADQKIEDKVEVAEKTPKEALQKDSKEENKQKEKLDEAEQAVSKQKSKKKKIWNWVFLAINIAVVVGLILYNVYSDGVASPAGLTIYFVPFLVLILVFGLNVFFDTFAISYLMKISTGKWRFGLSYKVNAIGRYYDNVTPLSAGGQPFQITYLKSHDVPLHSAMSIPLAKMAFQQLGWLLISIICLIAAIATQKYNTVVLVLSIVGFVLGSFMLFLVIFLSVSKNWGRKTVVGILKLLQKMKILKNYEKYYEKVMKIIEDYQSVMRQYAKSPKDLIILLVSYLARLMCIYTLPYLVFCVFRGFATEQYLNFLVMSVMIDLAASFCPLPGGTGMSEVTFQAMFAAYFAGGTFTWALILWRFFSLYAYLLQGVSIVIYDTFYGNRKYKWLQRRETLMAESAIFKQDQINRFRAERNKQRKNKIKK